MRGVELVDTTLPLAVAAQSAPGISAPLSVQLPSHPQGYLTLGPPDISIEELSHLAIAALSRDFSPDVDVPEAVASTTTLKIVI